MSKPYKRLTTRTTDGKQIAVLLPLTLPPLAVEALCQYEETGLPPEGVQQLQLLWQALLRQIIENAVELQPGVYGLTLSAGLLEEFRKDPALRDLEPVPPAPALDKPSILLN